MSDTTGPVPTDTGEIAARLLHAAWKRGMQSAAPPDDTDVRDLLATLAAPVSSGDAGEEPAEVRGRYLAALATVLDEDEAMSGLAGLVDAGLLPPWPHATPAREVWPPHGMPEPKEVGVSAPVSPGDAGPDRSEGGFDEWDVCELSVVLDRTGAYPDIAIEDEGQRVFTLDRSVATSLGQALLNAAAHATSAREQARTGVPDDTESGGER